MSKPTNPGPKHHTTLTRSIPADYGDELDMWPGDTFTNGYGDTWEMGANGKTRPYWADSLAYDEVG